MVNVNGCIFWCNAMVSAGYTGDTTDTVNNTLGCRAQYLATVTGTNNATTCPSVSLTGGSHCGSTLAEKCVTYCLLDIATCPETWEIQGNAPNATICGLGCGGYAGVGGFAATGKEFAPYDTTGDTVQCRTYHALAAHLLGYPHCAHATPLGGLQCGTASTAITNFCANTNLICDLFLTSQGGQSLWPYSSISQCVSDAANYSNTDLGVQWGWVNATGGDSIGCRAYHGGVPSLVDPVTHCPHTGWASVPCGGRTPTTAPTTAAPTTASTTHVPTTSSASTISAVLVVIVAILSLLF